MAYQSDNIFAKILAGELPAHKVYEDEHSFAFMDLMPQAPGHTLVIPKHPAEDLFDVPANALAHTCLLYTSPSPRDLSTSRMPSSA